MHVVVIGGGVIGLNQAIALADQFKVTIVANQFSAETNSVLATAMWHIFMLKLKKDHLTEKSIQSGDIHLTWAQVTLEKLIDWANHKNSGIVIRRGVEMFRSPPPEQNPAWVGLLQKSGMDFAPLSNREIANLNCEPRSSMNSDAQSSEGRIQYGYRLSTPVADMSVHLPWLVSEADKRGVNFVRRTLPSLPDALNELEDLNPDLVINCTGLNAREFSNDNSLIPFRGRYIKFFDCDDGSMHYLGDDENPDGMAYFIPNNGNAIAGGTSYPSADDVEFFDWECSAPLRWSTGFVSPAVSA